MSDERFVIVDHAILDGHPVRAVSYLEPVADWDSGFCLFAGESGKAFDSSLVCLDCLLEEDPEVGAGMEVARSKGEEVSYRLCVEPLRDAVQSAHHVARRIVQTDNSQIT